MSDHAEQRCEAPRSQRNPLGRRCQKTLGHDGMHDWQEPDDAPPPDPPLGATPPRAA